MTEAQLYKLGFFFFNTTKVSFIPNSTLNYPLHFTTFALQKITNYDFRSAERFKSQSSGFEGVSLTTMSRNVK
ncbi:hypothetical protein OB69_16610 [Roseivirga seohaensis subsp. aquiponti]|uniref:Uncharacterized protein n=1 Tax=Roseivirga seohaensis subsp. aquiponti TaxID=1566026 RepID=A0A0L8AH75_9BACT|nr:hypothetical protein OB69_16610 [Roseivirga seohaensis subsp. aquiponti]